ncbi:PREDICTED: F-box/LRR-repeat protein At3g48880-like [Camelina sativa]|uniref:F-box/LRR-repeat protein At3g48880-like n=1 Tax=Camelina sativa TaxID=90675 RepID=A0ABM0VDS8_CAMSA|nr:PREDICTED: F-box/LRR-repeat protein At3g48880-like [Camelina sativa]
MDQEASSVNVIETSDIKEPRTENVVKGWENLNTDILMRILEEHFSINELTSGLELAHVCRGWRAVCCDPLLWDTLDLSHLNSIYIKAVKSPYLYVPRRCDENVTRILKLFMSLSKGNTRTLIVNYNLFLTCDMLTYTAERCPNLRRLVLPAMTRISKTGMQNALGFCENLESLTIPSLHDSQFLFSSIVKKLTFRELKVMGHIHAAFAEKLVEHLPNLKVLSLRCNAIYRDALLIILDGLESLEVLNISHSYLVVKQEHPEKKKLIVRELDQTIMEKASKLKRFVTCMEYMTCVMCKRTEKDGGRVRWNRYEEGLWKTDEVSSLHL